MENLVSHMTNGIMLCIITNKFTGDDKPLFVDLLNNVVHQYAAQWEELGLKLGLPYYVIANISADHAFLRAGRLVGCCKAVLQEWLVIRNPSCTWGKLDDVIKSLTTAVLSNLTEGMVY